MSPAVEPPIIVLEAIAPEKQQIGSARMEPDGIITMMLRYTRGGFIGDAYPRFKPGTPDYDRVRAHLPDLRVGHPVPVYNDWPD